MKRIALAVMGGIALCCMAGASAQDGETPFTPEQIKEMQAYQEAAMVGPKQQELAKGVGTWDAEIEFWPVPGAPANVTQDKSVRKMVLGGRYMHEVFTSNFGGQPFRGEMMIGFNNVMNTWETNWCDNMSTAMTRGVGVEQEDGSIRYTFHETNPLTRSVEETWGFARKLDGGKERLEFWRKNDGKDWKMMQITYTPAK